MARATVARGGGGALPSYGVPARPSPQVSTFPS